MSQDGGTYTFLYDGSTNPYLKTYKFQSLTAGSTYNFRVYARNDKDYSDPSSALEVIAATLPFKMIAPTVTSVDHTTASVNLQWSVPALNGGSAITGYYL